MADNYNSSYTGTQVDDAVKKVSERGITTKDSQTTLTENRIVAGDTGGRNIKSTNISVSDVENAISRSTTFNSSGVTSANTLTSSYLVQGTGSKSIEATGITTSSVNTAISRASDYNTNGIKNGPKVDSSSDITTGNLVSYAGSNKITDANVATSSVSTMTIGVPESGTTGRGYLMLSENPGITKNSSISITAALQSAGSSSKFGTAVLYYGRNFYDVGHIQHTTSSSNLLGQRNVEYTVATDLQNCLYVAASNSVTPNGFTTLTSASAYSGKVYTFNLKYNHLYLVVSKWNLVARRPEVPSQVPFNPSKIGFYSGSTFIASESVTLTDSSGNKIEPSTETSAYTGGTVYAYAYLKPTFTYSGTSDTKSSWVYVQDATALNDDLLSGMFIIDVTDAGDDAYDVTALGSSERVRSLDQVFAKYLAGAGSYVAGSSVQRTKYNGPYYTAMDYFRPYYRNWFIRVPSGLRVYIKEYKTSNGSSPSGYIKTISVGPNTNISVALDQSVELGEACLEFMVGKADDSALPTIGTGSGQIAPNDESATATCAPLMQYVPAEFIGKTIDASGSLFSWVRHYPAINMANGATMEANSISASDYASGAGAWINTSFSASGATKTYNLSDVTTGSEDSMAIGTISFQTFGNAKFSMGLTLTDTSKTRIAYHVDSVNNNILHVEQQVNNINNNPVLSSLPTTEGSYSFKVKDEHTPGAWEKNKDLFEPYSPLKTYRAGDYVSHDELAYECLTDIPVAEAWNPSHWRAVNLSEIFGDINQEMQNKADIDGEYSTMTVGKAESIVSNRTIDDADMSCPPITFGIAGGEAEIQTGINPFEELRGNNIVWNQLLIATSSHAAYDVTTTFDSYTGVFSSSGTPSASSIEVSSARCGENRVGHKMLVKLEILSNPDEIAVKPRAMNDTNGNGGTYVTEGTTGFVFESSSDSGSYYGLQMEDSVEINELEYRFQLFDLTVMGLENITTVEEFIEKFPLNYYQYNNGEILWSRAYSLISRGKNQFAGLDTFTKVVPGEEYEISGITRGGVLTQYDANKNLLVTSSTFTTTTRITMTENTYFVQIAATTYGDIMFYMTFPEDGGVYNEPYIEPRVETIQLPNIVLRSVGTARDIAYASGGGIRKVGEVNLGSLGWDWDSGKSAFVCYGLPKPLNRSSNNGLNLLCLKYKTRNNYGYQSLNDKEMSTRSNFAYVYIRDDSFNGSTSAFKAAMNGVMLYYEMETPEEMTELENPGWPENIYVDNFGTLEFTTAPDQTPQVPQAYFIKYTISLTEFLDTAYIHADGDANNLALQSEIDNIKSGVVIVGESVTAQNLTPYSENSGSTGLDTFVMQTSGGDSVVSNQAFLKSLRGNSIV